MAGYPLPPPRFSATDDNGAPLVGGKLFLYAADGTTPQTAYSDQALTVPHTNPVILDGRGEAAIFVPEGTPYRVVLKTSADVVVWPLTEPFEVPSTAPAAAPASSVPTGAVLPYAGASVPTGFLLCDGAAVSRTTYADLFTAIGVAHGPGDGATTFNVPDMRGRFPLGKAAAGTGSTLGATGGALDHTHTLATHTHTLTTDGAHTHTVPRIGWGKTSGTPDPSGTIFSETTGSATILAANDVTTGSGGSHTHTVAAGGPTATGAQNPAYAVVNFIVKT